MAYYIFRDAHANVVLASPGGGYPPMDLSGADGANAMAAIRRFRGDRRAREELADTLDLHQVYAEDFDACFCLGADGPIWRFPRENPGGSVIAAFLDQRKPVVVVSNRPMTSRPDNGLMIVQDRDDASTLGCRALLGAIRSRSP